MEEGSSGTNEVPDEIRSPQGALEHVTLLSASRREQLIALTRKTFEDEGLPFLKRLENRQAAYLVLVSAAVKEIKRQHPSATVQDVLTILDNSHALFKYAQADEWLQAMFKKEGIHVLHSLDEIVQSLAAAIGARRTQLQGDFALATFVRGDGENLHQLMTRFKSVGGFATNYPKFTN